MNTQVTIIAGHDDNEAREMRTRDWLQKHGATIEEYSGLQVVTVQAPEKPGKGQYTGEYIVGFDNAEGDQEQSYLVISLEPDPYDTSIEVKYYGDYGCSCKGLGCIKCNDELAALANGVNPWEHHTRA